ncbi:MAG: hypothetical protein ACOY46_12175 [Bacillota bacterium]
MQLFFEQIIDKEGCMSYIIGCPQSKEAAVVDANHNINSYLDLLKKHDMKLKYIVDTHTHADHNSFAGKLGYERVNNPFLKNTTRELFTAYTGYLHSITAI